MAQEPCAAGAAGMLQSLNLLGSLSNAIVGAGLVPGYCL